VAGLLIAIAIFDLKFHRIPNIAVALVVVLDVVLGAAPNNFSILLFLIPASVLAWIALMLIYIVRGATLKIAIPLAPAISGGYLLSIFT
jgi:hypothetical protein